MNDINVTDKNENEILNIISEWHKQGYHIWLQKRCSDKFLLIKEDLSPSYKINGALDVDNSTIFKRTSLDLEQFKGQSCVNSAKKELNISCHVSEKDDGIIMFPRKTLVDLQGLLSPKLNQENEDQIQKYFEIIKDVQELEQQKNYKDAINILKNQITELENQLTDQQILQVIYVETLLILGTIYIKSEKYFEGKMYLEKCIKLFMIKDQILLAQIYLKLGQCCLQVYSFQKSVDYFNQALVIYEIYDLKSEIALTMIYIALVYSKCSQYDLAQKIALSALELPGNQQTKHTGLMYQLIGEVHYYNENYVEAIEYFDTSFDLSQSYKNVQTNIKIINFIGSCCFHLGEYIKSKELFESALSQVETNSLNEAQILNNLALCQKALKQECKANFKRCLKIYLQYYPQNHPTVKKILKNEKLI